MKKVLIFGVLSLMLVGCGKEMQTTKCTLKSNDVANGYELTSTYEINHKGGYVESVKTIEEVTSDDETILEYFETTLEDTYSAYSDSYGGYTYDIVNENGKVTSTVTIDYNKMDMDAYVSDNTAVESYVEDGKFTFEGAKAIYEALGATCEE